MSAPAIPCPPHRRGPRLTQGGGLLRVALAGMLILAGCTDFPDMTGRLTDADTGQGYPALVPAEELLAGTQEQGASLAFRRSNAGKRDKTVEVGLSALHSDFEAYEAFTGRLAGRISYDSTPIWQKRLTYSYGFEILGTNEQDFNFTTGTRDRRTFYIAALPGQLTFDTTDSLLDPTEGFRLSAKLSPEASLGTGRQFYGRGLIEGTAYFEVDDGIILAGRARVGSIAGAERELIAPSRR